jgi:hypothetical protein
MWNRWLLVVPLILTVRIATPSASAVVGATVGVAYSDNQSSISFPQTTCFIQAYRRTHGVPTYMGSR